VVRRAEELDRQRALDVPETDRGAEKGVPIPGRLTRDIWHGVSLLSACVAESRDRSDYG